MQEKFLKEVINVVVGKQAEPLAEMLSGKKFVNEFLIAKKLDLTINQTRNILYRLSDKGLVSFERKKDKKKGWYTYFWKIDVLKTLQFLEEFLMKKQEQIKMQIKSRETKVFYICKKCNIEFTEENAMHHDFMCDECGEVFELKDNARLLKELKKNLEKIEETLKLVREEIEKEQEKLDKKKVRKIVKEKKEKKAKRDAKKKLRDKAKEKEAKKSGKKYKKKVPKSKKKNSLSKKPTKKKSVKKSSKKKPKKKTKKKSVKKVSKSKKKKSSKKK